MILVFALVFVISVVVWNISFKVMVWFFLLSILLSLLGMVWYGMYVLLGNLGSGWTMKFLGRLLVYVGFGVDGWWASDIPICYQLLVSINCHQFQVVIVFCRCDYYFSEHYSYYYYDHYYYLRC